MSCKIKICTIGNKVQKLAEAYFAEQENGKISFHRLYKRCNDQNLRKENNNRTYGNVVMKSDRDKTT